MTQKETKVLLAVIKAAYPEFYRDATDFELEATAALWNDRLQGYAYSQCDTAIKQHIDENRFAPKIAEIIKRITDEATPKLASGVHHSEWERKSFEQSEAWYKNHTAKLHSEGKLTAVECKERGLTYQDYCAQF